MKEKRTSLEVVAATVEEAIETGLADMELSIDDVDIDYIDEGSKGLFGLGGRQAKIRITKKGFKPVVESIPEPVEENHYEELKSEPKKSTADIEPIKEKVVPNGIEDPILQTARETVSELLEQMKIHAQVTSTFTENTEDANQQGVLVEITGDDLSILIGRKAETLNALQYISSLIVCKRLEKWLPLMIDVEGYRQRREKQLTQLAIKMAEQAVATGRRQTLEPMPANERRIIHIALRDHPAVVTESTGEEPYRKLTILPKK